MARKILQDVPREREGHTGARKSRVERVCEPVTLINCQGSGHSVRCAAVKSEPFWQIQIAISFDIPSDLVQSRAEPSLPSPECPFYYILLPSWAKSDLISNHCARHLGLEPCPLAGLARLFLSLSLSTLLHLLTVAIHFRPCWLRFLSVRRWLSCHSAASSTLSLMMAITLESLLSFSLLHIDSLNKGSCANLEILLRTLFDFV